jgi:CRISPR/Cas system-associated endonuclease Cas1
VRVMSTLYVRDHNAKVGLQKQTLMVTSGTHKTRVPLETLDGVILLGGAQVTTEADGRLREARGTARFSPTEGQAEVRVGGPVSSNVHLRVARAAVGLTGSPSDAHGEVPPWRPSRLPSLRH